MPRLSNKTCVITGAARGIGAAIAEAFVTEGANVILTDLYDSDGAATAQRLGAKWLPLDVRSEDDWAALSKAHPTFDVLVNNAGITGFEEGATPHDPENASLDDWHAVHVTNLDGTFLGCRTAIRAMRAAKAGIPGAAAYASSKAAIRNHTKTVALYCAQQGLNIRCNAIFPAAVLTPMWEPMLGHGPDRAKRMAAFVAETPLKRFGTPDEVAALAVMLASDEAAYMTGAELTIDGGLLAGAAASPA